MNFWLKTKKRKYHHLSFFLIQNSPFCLINYDSSKRLIINQPLSIVERMERSSFPCTNHPWPQAQLGRENLCWGQLCPDMGPATNPETFFLLFFLLTSPVYRQQKGCTHQNSWDKCHCTSTWQNLGRLSSNGYLGMHVSTVHSGLLGPPLADILTKRKGYSYELQNQNNNNSKVEKKLNFLLKK